MASKRPLFAENFSANLTDIETFLADEGSVFLKRLLKKLVEETVPMLCRFPLSGRSFFERSIQTTQALELVGRMKGRLRKGDDVRELIVDDYLILYLVRGDQIVFLSIKHHRQLSYDLKLFWQD
jgi:plasmid stabilization system protein ParE